MKIELKILRPDIYIKNELLLTYPAQKVYQNLPSYAKLNDAGCDLRVTEDVTIYPGESCLISTGVAIWIGSARKGNYGVISEFGKDSPYNLMGMIVPRSGLGLQGLILGNTVGIIDESYQGEIMISAWNRLDANQYKQVGNDGSCVVRYNYENTINLKAGDRIAQLILFPVLKATWSVVDEFSATTERGCDGWGSTDIK